ncbi:TetR family transcriptional regulator [Shimia isoporae]|uniref:TetR family transcriptional regulator n=1 Tax=Shimia isoporae TaxID=647720 RepID=A0A4R1N2E9_9RHOB|nr:TetR/AcrR family transcriptional regulator [Shimia isoporae]TCL00479.1 TetR family transcriptional regulator [Shimia isoporae]
MSKRLSKQDWLKAGFVALTEAGGGALKAEPMARRLKTTKGSFYWHFKDVPAFHSAILKEWESKAYADIVTQIEEQESAVHKLRALGQIAVSGAPADYGGIALEPAIRAWGRSDPKVAEAIARVDGLRMQYLSALMKEIGLTNPELVRILYASVIGMDDLSSRDGEINGPAMGTLVDLILALYQ